MPEVDPWEAYFYPETIDAMGQGTLRNKYELRDREALRLIEYGMTARSGRTPATFGQLHAYNQAPITSAARSTHEQQSDQGRER